MEQQDRNTGMPQKETNASEKITKMDVSYGGPHVTGSKLISASSGKPEDKDAVENGLTYISDDSCEYDIDSATLVSKENELQTQTETSLILEKCPMCEMTFDSAELLDDHLLSPESCRQVVTRIPFKNIPKDTEATDSSEISKQSVLKKGDGREHAKMKDDNHDSSELRVQETRNLSLTDSVKRDSEHEEEIKQLSTLPKSIENGPEGKRNAEPEVLDTEDSLGEMANVKQFLFSSKSGDNIVEMPLLLSCKNKKVTGGVKQLAGSEAKPVSEALDCDIAREERKDEEVSLLFSKNNESITEMSPIITCKDTVITDCVKKLIGNDEETVADVSVIDVDTEERKDDEKSFLLSRNNENIVDISPVLTCKDVEMTDCVEKLNENKEDIVPDISGVNAGREEKKVEEEQLLLSRSDESVVDTSPVLSCKDAEITDWVEALTGNDEETVPDVSVIDVGTEERKNDEESLLLSGNDESIVGTSPVLICEDVEITDCVEKPIVNEEKIVPEVSVSDGDKETRNGDKEQSLLSRNNESIVDTSPVITCEDAKMTDCVEKLTGNDVETVPDVSVIDVGTEERKNDEESLLLSRNDESIVGTSPVLICEDVEITDCVEKPIVNVEKTVPEVSVTDGGKEERNADKEQSLLSRNNESIVDTSPVITCEDAEMTDCVEKLTGNDVETVPDVSVIDGGKEERKVIDKTLLSLKSDENIVETSSPVLTCVNIEVTDDNELHAGSIAKHLPVVPVTETVVITYSEDTVSKENSLSTSSTKSISYNGEVECMKQVGVPDINITNKSEQFKDTRSKESVNRDETGIVEIIDLDSDEFTSEKLPLPPKINAKENTMVKLNSTATSELTSNEKTIGEENNKDMTVRIKKKFTTGNTTLDHDIVEILQDATKSGGRVTRSMRKVTAADKTSPDEKSPPAETVKYKLVTSPSVTGTAKAKLIQRTSSNNSLLLQVPASSVQSGSKFIITIPSNNAHNTPAGKYLITIPPTDPATGEMPQAKTVLLKASANTTSPTTTTPNPINADSLRIVKSSPPTVTPKLVSLLNKPVKTLGTDISSETLGTDISGETLRTDISCETRRTDISIEEEQVTQLKKTIMLSKQTKKVYVKELEQIDDVIFECPKCKGGFPLLLLVQLHMEDCCHHPPTQTPTNHMKIPTELLLKFYAKQLSANCQIYKCLCCQEVLSYRNYRIGKFYPSLASHFAKHTSPAVKVVNYTTHSKTKELGDALTVHSKQSVEWINYMIPPFSLGNRPVSHKNGNLQNYLCTSNKLHQESLLLLEYDSDELEEEMYLERRKKESKKKKKKKSKGGINDTGVYVCNWKSAIVKEDSNIVEVNEVGTPKSAFPTDIHKSGSLKHSILHSPSKATILKAKHSSLGRSSSKKKKDKSKIVGLRQLVFDDNINRRRSPRKGATENVFISLPQKKKKSEKSLEKDTQNEVRTKVQSQSKNASSDDEIILLSSEDDLQHNINSKEAEGHNQSTNNAPPNAASAKQPVVPQQESIDDDSSRGSLPSLPESTAAKSQYRFEPQRSAICSRESSLDTELPNSNVPRAAVDGYDDLIQGREREERPSSRASNSSIICLSDSDEIDNLKKDGNMSKTQSNNLSQQQTSTKTIMPKVFKNAAEETNKQKTPEIANSENNKSDNVNVVVDKVAQVVKKKKVVPEAEVDDIEEITLISDTEEDEDDGTDLNSDDYDPILLDKYQIRTYFQQSREEAGIYECSLSGSASCECVAESDLFEHLSQHINVEKVHPQKRSKTILFKGKVVPQYLKLMRHQIWAHFCNITLDSDMEICDEYMQQYRQCRWGNCGQRVWTKYGRLSHHLRSHLRFTQIDPKRYEKIRNDRKLANGGGWSSGSLGSPVTEARPLRVSDGDQVICLPEDVILSKYKYGKSPTKNVRGVFTCLVCEYSHHLDSSATAVMTVKILACHMKQHLPLSNSHMYLITPKAITSCLKPVDYDACVHRSLISTKCRDIESIRDLPKEIVTSCFDMLKAKFLEPAVMGAIVPVLNKDSVVYRCLYAGCQIGVAGDKDKDLLRHIREHTTVIMDKDVSRQDKGESPQKHLDVPKKVMKKSAEVTSEIANRKRKASIEASSTEDNITVTQSKHIKMSDTDRLSAPQDVEDAYSDDDIVELIDESSQDSRQSLSEDRPLKSASQEDSQESMVISGDGSSAKNESSVARAIDSATVVDGSELPEWSTSNRGLNSVTGIEPSRDNPSRSMDELRHSPNDVIICSMPDVEAYFCEHIVKYSSYVSSLSDKVTFGKPSYSCPECGVTGLKGVALKQHLEGHVGKTIKWKSLIKHAQLPVSEIDTTQGTPTKYRTMLKSKRFSQDRIRPHKMKLSSRKWHGKNGVLNNTRKSNIRLVGQGVHRARQNFNNILSRILNRERNLRRVKITRSPLSNRLSPFEAKVKTKTCRRSIRYEDAPDRNLENDLSTQVQSSSTKDAKIGKQCHEDGNGQVQKQVTHDESCVSKCTIGQTEVVDLVDSETEIISVGSDETEMSNAMQMGDANEMVGDEPEESQGDDLFLTIDDILKEYFTKEEKLRSRKGLGMNFIVVQYKCRRCNFTTLTVLDVPEHVAFHIKRKVILKIKMEK